MKRFLRALATSLVLAGAGHAEEVKLGILLDYSEPRIRSPIGTATLAEVAMAEVNASGRAKNTYVPVRGNATCVGPSETTAVAVADQMVGDDGVKGIIAATCDRLTTAVLTNIGMPNGVPLVSTYEKSDPFSPEPKDGGLFFRIWPSFLREGEVMADILIEKGITAVAVAYSDSEHSKSKADFLTHAFTAKGIKTTTAIAYVKKTDYSAEIAALKSGGGDALIFVADSVNSGDTHIIHAVKESGAFSTFGFTDSVSIDDLLDVFGLALDGSFGVDVDLDRSIAGSIALDDFIKTSNPSFNRFTGLPEQAAYDAAALIMLAIEASGSTDPNVYKSKMIEIANGTGDDTDFTILPGELGKALRLIDAGIPIDYDGVSSVNFMDNGESADIFRQYEIKGGVDKTVKYR